ncbi:hypothetical protein Tco_0482109 [Tanacetum coccineum]
MGIPCLLPVNGHSGHLTINGEGIELILWGDLKIMMESSTEENVQGDFWNKQQEWEFLNGRRLEVEEESIVALHLQTAFGKDKSNPLIVDSLLKTIRLSIHLVVYNEELAIPEQTAPGKGISNPLMAGSLPKTTKPT